MTLPTHLAQVDREHFKIVDRVPGGFYWRSSPDLAWMRKTEIDGEICWWMLERMQKVCIEFYESDEYIEGQGYEIAAMHKMYANWWKWSRQMVAETFAKWRQEALTVSLVNGEEEG